MKNKEVLVQILLMLRKNGINNEKILFAVEKMPPHYFIHLVNNENKFYNSDYIELIRLLKILQDALTDLDKIDNVLISGFRMGWFITVCSLLAKRIYSFSSEKNKIKRILKTFNFLNISNIYIKKSSNFTDWKQVAPFDLIILFNKYDTIPYEVLKLLSRKGLLFFTKENNHKFSI